MKFVYPHHLWHRLQLWSKAAAPREVGWIGRCAVDGDTITADDVYLFPRQTATGGNFAVTPEDVAALYETLLARDVDPGSLNLVGHSHVNMPAFKSGPDLEHDTAFLGGLAWGVSVVHNLKGETAADLYINRPMKMRLAIRVSVAEVFYTDDAEQEAAAKACLISPARSTVARADGRIFRFKRDLYDDDDAEVSAWYGGDGYHYGAGRDYRTLAHLETVTRSDARPESDRQSDGNGGGGEYHYPKHLARRFRRARRAGDCEIRLGDVSYRIGEGNLLYEARADKALQVVTDLSDVAAMADLFDPPQLRMKGGKA